MFDDWKPIILRDEDQDDPPATVIKRENSSDAAGKAAGTGEDKSGKKAQPGAGAAEDGEGGQSGAAGKPGAAGDAHGAANAAFAALRTENSRLTKQVEELSGKFANVVNVLQKIGGVPGAEEDTTGDPKQKLLKRLAEDPIATIADIAKGAYQEVSEAERFQITLANARKAVVDRYPALRDQNSYEFQVFNAIVTNNPEYFRLAKGPLYAMRDMEDRFAAEGYKPKTTVSNGDAGAEGNEDASAFIPAGAPVGAAAHIPTGGVGMRPGSSGTGQRGPVELTVAQKEYCTRNGINPKIYLQVIKGNSQGGFRP